MNNTSTFSYGQLLQLQMAQQAGTSYAQGIGIGIGYGLVVGCVCGVFVAFVITEFAKLIGYYTNWWSKK